MGDCKRLAQRIANEETPEALQADVEPAKTDQRERIEAINALIESYIKQGRVGEAQRVAVELGGRSLSTEEIDALVEHWIKQEIVSISDALEAAELGASKEAIDAIVEFCIKQETEH